MDHLLHQIYTFTNRANRPSDSLMLEQYKRCEKAIDHQVNKMKNNLKKDHSINEIKEPINSKIKKECYPWIYHIDAETWNEDGHDNTGKKRAFEDTVNDYMKKNNYKKYVLENGRIDFYSNNNEKYSVKLFMSKMITNPFYRHINHNGGKFHMEIEKINDTDSIVKMHRYWERCSDYYGV